MTCSVVKELMPNYIDGLTSDETSEDIKKHLASCESCCAVYEYLRSTHPSDAAEKKKDMEFVKDLKAGVQKRKRRSILAVFAILIIGILFTRRYSVPIPFDANRMFIETVPSAFTVNDEYGWVDLTNIDGLDFQESKSVLSGKLDVMNLVWLSYRGIHNAGSWSKGRTISRNGEKVRVIYYRYTKTLWDLMLPSDLFAQSESASNYGEIYGDSAAFDGGVHEPEQREIYYLQVRNLDALDELSDKEYDALRQKASLIWSGVN